MIDSILVRSTQFYCFWRLTTQPPPPPPPPIIITSNTFNYIRGGNELIHLLHFSKIFFFDRYVVCRLLTNTKSLHILYSTPPKHSFYSNKIAPLQHTHTRAHRSVGSSCSGLCRFRACFRHCDAHGSVQECILQCRWLDLGQSATLSIVRQPVGGLEQYQWLLLLIEAQLLCKPPDKSNRFYNASLKCQSAGCCTAYSTQWYAYLVLCAATRGCWPRIWQADTLVPECPMMMM
jgi:hypothetical protein